MPVPFFLALNLAECALFLAAHLHARIDRPRGARWTAAVVVLAAAAYLGTFVAMLLAGARAR